MNTLIGITGLAGAGKNTLATAITEYAGHEQIAFADALKDKVAVDFGWRRNALEGDTEDSREWRELPNENACGKTPRQVLQEVGVFYRSIDPDYWVKRAIPTDMTRRYVFSDVRFENEVAAIQGAGGIIVRVMPVQPPEWWDLAASHPHLMPETYPDVHESEWRVASTPCDCIVINCDFNTPPGGLPLMNAARNVVHVDHR